RSPLREGAVDPACSLPSGLYRRLRPLTGSADPSSEPEGARGLGDQPPYRRWGIAPRPENAWTIIAVQQKSKKNAGRFARRLRKICPSAAHQSWMTSRSEEAKRSVTFSPTLGGIIPGLLNMSKEMVLPPTFMRVRMTEPRKWAEETSPVRAVSPFADSASEPASGRSA